MTSDLDIHPDLTPTPTTLFASASPAVVVARATEIADAIAPLIRDQHLVKRIGQSEHVFLEGWTLAGTMLGVFPITVASGPIYEPDGSVSGYQATVEARTMAGAVVGRADAECTRDENDKWRNAPSFQLRSMAITRASSKALRMPLGFVMKLAGYETTPAEEMEAAAARGETVTGGRGVRPGWRDFAEQQRAHADLGALIDEHGLRQWIADYLDSKGYERPLAKAQFNQLRRAIERELADRGGGKDAPTPLQDTPSRGGVEAANQSKPERDAGTGSGAASTPPGSSPPEPGGSNRPAGDAKGKRAAGRATSTATAGRGNATDTSRSDAQAGSAETPPTEGPADPSLPDPGRSST